MSSQQETTLQCKGCGTMQPFVAWSSLNVSLDRDLKKQLLNRQLTLFKCNKCGWSGEVRYPILYHDMEKRLMIWLLPDDKVPAPGASPGDKVMGVYRFRLVRTTNQLIEKVLIFDAGLDDRAIEFYKLMLRMGAVEEDQTITGEVLFNDCNFSQDGQAVMRFRHLDPAGSKELVVPRSSLSEVDRLLARALRDEVSEQGKWLVVDLNYARTLLEKVNA